MKAKPYRSVKKIDIAYIVNARQKTYRSSTEIYIPKEPYEKIPEGYELSSGKSQSGQSKPTSEEEKLERSRRRTYNVVKDIALSNVFDLFATFTFKSNRYDDEVTRNKMAGWLKRRRKEDKRFEYLIVSELHKRCEECVENSALTCVHDDRPKAIHYHALMKNYSGPLFPALNPRNGDPLMKRHRPVWYFPNFTLGYNEAYVIGYTEEDLVRSGFYLLKYLKKDMTTFKGKKRYWSSRGLNKPITIENPEEWYVNIEADHSIEMPHGKFLFFDNERIRSILS